MAHLDELVDLHDFHLKCVFDSTSDNIIVDPTRLSLEHNSRANLGTCIKNFYLIHVEGGEKNT